MTGLEAARALYDGYGRDMIERHFSTYAGRIAVGLAGHGSECFAFDDEVSRDHDYKPGFCLWLTDDDYAAVGNELSRMYRALPRKSVGRRSLMGGDSTGPMTISGFYSRYTGSPGAPESFEQWLSIPSWALAEATNGELWRDELGEFSRIRQTLLTGMPEDVRKKKIAARAFTMAQAGQYNYSRCLAHGQAGAAMLAIAEFVNAAADMIYLLNRRHMPYYKWALRGMSSLARLGNLSEALEYLLTGDNDTDGQTVKAGVIEDVCRNVISELTAQKLTDGSWDYLEPHAFEVMERIENNRIRAKHIMEG